MPSAFNKANAANQAEVKRLEQLIANLKFINAYHNASNSPNWLWYWENNTGNGLSEDNIARIQRASRAREANPANYNIKKLQNNKNNISKRRTVRYWMYGYVPKSRANWVRREGYIVPPNLPASEINAFRRVGKSKGLVGSHGGPMILSTKSSSGHWRNAFTAEGTLKPAVYTARRKPSPAKRPEPHLPTLKELAWKTTPMSTMTNEQLRFMSQMTPINLTFLKPKKRAAPLPANNLTKYRRQAAARVIGKAAKKYLKRKAPQRVKGPSPRSPATLARQAHLGIMGGARRSPVRAANNTRVTWSRNANGKISIHKTLTNLNLGLTNAQRMVLESMPQNQAINAIRQMARER